MGYWVWIDGQIRQFDQFKSKFTTQLSKGVIILCVYSDCICSIKWWWVGEKNKQKHPQHTLVEMWSVSAMMHHTMKYSTEPIESLWQLTGLKKMSDSFLNYNKRTTATIWLPGEGTVNCRTRRAELVSKRKVEPDVTVDQVEQQAQRFVSTHVKIETTVAATTWKFCFCLLILSPLRIIAQWDVPSWTASYLQCRIMHECLRVSELKR